MRDGELREGKGFNKERKDNRELSESGFREEERVECSVRRQRDR